MLKRARIAVLVSGGGTNLQALIDAAGRGEIPHGEIVLVVSNRRGAYALERAREAGIEAAVVSRADYPDAQTQEDALIALLEDHDIDLIVLAGFLLILSERFTKRFEGRIINIHPSLIPSFCGEGMYGLKVHAAALAAGVKLTGATVHFVNEIPDGGKIIAQKAVEIREGDTPEVLQQRVMEEAEWVLLPRAVEAVASVLVS